MPIAKAVQLVLSFNRRVLFRICKGDKSAYGSDNHRQGSLDSWNRSAYVKNRSNHQKKSLQNNDFRAHIDSPVKVNNVLVEQANTA
jgi:hypothetical protein